MGFATEGIVIAARLLIVLTLVPAASAKLGRSSTVAASLGKWKLVSEGLALPAARLVMFLEVVVLLSMASDLATTLGAITGVVLFCGIAIASSSVLVRGISTSCSCFSLEGTERVSRVTVARAAVLAALSGLVAFASDWALTLDLGWSSLLLLLTIPMWIALVRRIVRDSRLRPAGSLPTGHGP